MVTILSDSQSSEFAAPSNLTGVEIKGGSGVGVLIAATVTTPSAGTFTAAVSDICTKASHGFKTGLKVQVSNSGGALPTGLSAATDYFVIYLSASTFSLASSLVLAQAGTAIDISGTGSGTQTITPTAIAGCSFKLQGSMDDVTYADIPVTASGDVSTIGTITATANFFVEKVNPLFNYIRTAYTLTAGQISVVQTTVVKG